jgi:hypothetical protein
MDKIKSGVAKVRAAFDKVASLVEANPRIAIAIVGAVMTVMALAMIRV